MAKSKGTIQLGAIAGIRIYLHWSFFLLLAYLLFSELYRGSGFTAAVELVLFVMVVFVTVVLHELGHALTAKRYGCVTRDIILLPIGGVARMDELPEKPWQEIKVALAGPAVNLLLAGVTYLVFFRERTLPAVTQLTGLEFSSWPAHFFYTNAALALFNLLPAFPMDGGRILRGILSLRLERLRATVIASRLGQVIAFGMAIAGFFYNPMLIFIAVFIFFGAQMESDYLFGRYLLKGVAVRDVIMQPLVTIAEEASLGDAMRLLLSSQSTRFIVLRGDVPVGVLDRHTLLQQIEEKGQDHPVADCMHAGVPVYASDDALESVYRRMQRGNEQLVLVRDRGALTGYVDLDNVAEYLLFRKAMLKRNRFEIHP